jgi:hypothetical protein
MTDQTTSDQSTDTPEDQHVESVLDKLRAALDELRVQAELGTADVRARLEPKIEALRQRQGEAWRALNDAKSAGTDAWKTGSSRAGNAVDELGDAFSKISDEVQRAVTTAGSVVTSARDAFFEEWHRRR